ncbi:hypothetical protein [Rhodovulum steppense]|uniref:hypothetical protein n=1 Tax=Rhodovulum steppense TaxID=540251 RepID=UPI0014052894|nr:hypothetical protein [Rhodovulum steppense]
MGRLRTGQAQKGRRGGGQHTASQINKTHQTIPLSGFPVAHMAVTFGQSIQSVHMEIHSLASGTRPLLQDSSGRQETKLNPNYEQVLAGLPQRGCLRRIDAWRK